MIGRILARAMHGWRSHFVAIHVLMLVLHAPAYAMRLGRPRILTLGAAGAAPYGFEINAVYRYGLDVPVALAGLLVLVGSWLAGARIIVRLADRWGIPREPWRWSRGGRVVVLAVLAATLSVLPMFLLGPVRSPLVDEWVPGALALAIDVIVFSAFWVSLPLLALRDVGVMGALGQSWRLARGSRAIIFGLVLLLGVLHLVPLAVVSLPWGGVFAYYAACVFVATFKACVLASSYLELAGVPEADLDRVFD